MEKGRRVLRVVALFVAVAAGVLAPPCPAAAGGLDDARARGKLLVGVKTDFPPFGYLDNAGKPQGFDVEIARYLARDLFPEGDAERFEPVPVTTGSRIPFLYSEWIDMIVATMSVTEERKRVLDFSEPYFLSASLLLVPAGSPVRGIGDLAGKTVAVVRGSVQEYDLPHLAPAARLVRFGKVTEALQALKDGKAEALCQDEAVILALAKENSGLAAAGKPFLSRPYAIAVRKGDADTLRWINENLAAMKKDGSYDRLLEKFFGATVGKGAKP